MRIFMPVYCTPYRGFGSSRRQRDEMWITHPTMWVFCAS